MISFRRWKYEKTYLLIEERVISEQPDMEKMRKTCSLWILEMHKSIFIFFNVNIRFPFLCSLPIFISQEVGAEEKISVDLTLKFKQMKRANSICNY